MHLGDIQPFASVGKKTSAKKEKVGTEKQMVTEKSS